VCYPKSEQLNTIDNVINNKDTTKDIPKENLISQFNKNEKVIGKKEMKKILKVNNSYNDIEGK